MSKDVALATLERAERMLASVSTIAEANEAESVAAAAERYATKMRLGTASLNHAAALKSRVRILRADLVDQGQSRGEIATPGGNPSLRKGCLLKSLGLTDKQVAEDRLLRDTYGPAGIAEAERDATARDIELTTTRLIKDARAGHRRDDVAAARKTYAVPEGIDVRIGPFADVLADIEDGTVDLILTDPPYAAEAVRLYAQLAEWAAAKLKPGGSLIAYCGQSTLPDVLDATRPHLRYWWMLAVEHSAGQRLPGKFVIAEWKPAVWLVRDKRAHKRLVSDRLRPGTKPDQSEHRWAQDAAQLVPLIEQLTDPGDLIVDPFAGTGGFGIVAAGMNRKWVGADLGTAVAA